MDDTPGLKLLSAILSVVAGSADVISFLGLGGLFVAHITGNLVILAAHLVAGDRVGVSHVLAVPVFIVALAAARLLVAGLETRGLATLRPLLLVQFLMLVGAFALGSLIGRPVHPDGTTAVLAGMLGVCAMATQNALVQVSIDGAPTTAVMTTNVTRFTMDVGEVLLGREPEAIAAARRRAAHTWPAIAGFAAGAALGAAFYAAVGLTSLALPTGVALLALVPRFQSSAGLRP